MAALAAAMAAIDWEVWAPTIVEEAAPSRLVAPVVVQTVAKEENGVPAA